MFKLPKNWRMLPVQKIVFPNSDFGPDLPTIGPDHEVKKKVNLKKNNKIFLKLQKIKKKFFSLSKKFFFTKTKFFLNSKKNLSILSIKV